MKKKTRHSSTLPAVVLVVGETDEELLLTVVLGQPVWRRQVEKLQLAGVREIFWLLPLAADRLRQAVQESTVGLELTMTVLNQDPKMHPYDNLWTYQSHWGEQIVLAWGLDMSVSFAYGQLLDWQAPLVVAVQRPATCQRWGQAVVDGRYIRACGLGKNMQDYSLLGTYLVGEQFWQTVSGPIFAMRDWWQAVSEFAAGQVVKPCEFLPADQLANQVWQTKKQRQQWLTQLAGQLMNETEATISTQAVLASSVKRSGKVVIAAGAEVADWVQLQGPVYLGSGVQVASFSTIGPDAYLEAGCMVDSYARVCGQWLPVGTQIKTKIKQEMVLNESVEKSDIDL